ncbi:MAG TPA: GNAT family N-acetyltransferase [Rhizobiales bacterium]|nr:GNAT family N-acetyltransferase [Hyphomicrobiales bacterium]
MPGTDTDWSLRRMPPDDAQFLEALAEAGMPHQDMAETNGAFFILADGGGRALGYCGYELLGQSLALIRSCVVPRAHRGKGAGRAMIAALIERLAGEGRRELYLFTVDAGPFFARFGFELSPRAAAPEAIRASSQFDMACCEGAVLMRRAP